VKSLSRDAVPQRGRDISVDNSAGHIGDLKPGDPGYATAALADARHWVVFRRGAAIGGARTVTMPGGAWFGLYLVPNASSRKALAKAQTNPGARGHVLFSFAAANPGERPFTRFLTGNRVAFEDSLNADRDFNDFIGKLVFHPAQGSAIPIFSPPPSAPAPAPAPAPLPPPEPPNIIPSDWTVPPLGGSPIGHGSVTFEDGEAILREGDSFEVRMERTFSMPAEPAMLTIEYRQMNFDRSGRDAIRDAFEAAFLDDQGNPLAFTTATNRDSFFNTTEDQPIETAPGVADNGRTVSLNLANLPAGTGGSLVLRLVNNDDDTDTSVGIRRVTLTPPAIRGGGRHPLASAPSSASLIPPP
jgi:hypothetical protein